MGDFAQSKENFMMESGLADNPDKDVPPVSAAEVAEHVWHLLFSGRVPELTAALADVPNLTDIHYYLIELRRQLGNYAKGDFSAEIRLRGVVAGMVKALQANMRHLIWQMEQIKAGDLTQRVDFMGEFATAFNNMAQQLDDALTALHEKEAQLTAITNELQQEVEKRGAALSALQKSEENFKYLAEHDPLTNLLNRRSFFARAEVEMARNTIMDQYSAVVVMDVDHFKNFNDTYGHLDGDQALRHIAKVGGSTLRDNDIMGRLGGEEFIFLFSKANQEQGRLAAERIRRMIESSPVELDDASVKVTASFGVVAVPPGQAKGVHEGLMEYAIELADQALYRSKAQGRNQVAISEFHPVGSSCAYTPPKYT